MQTPKISSVVSYLKWSISKSIRARRPVSIRSLALWPGDSLAVLKDDVVERLQLSRFPFWLLSTLQGSGFYPDGTDSY